MRSSIHGAPARWWYRIRRKTLAKAWSLLSENKPAYRKATFMRYPIAIETGTGATAFGVAIPDLPGCFSAGDTLDEAIDNAEAAATLWIDAALDAGHAIPKPSSVDDIRNQASYAGWLFGLVTVDPAQLDDTIERVNITLPRRVLRRLDRKAREAGETRSGYIARMAIG